MKAVYANAGVASMEDNGVFTSYLSIYIYVCVWGGATTFHCTYLQHAMPLKVFLYLTQKRHATLVDVLLHLTRRRHATLVGVLLGLTQRRHATLVDAQEAEIEFFQVKHAPWNFHGMLEDTMVRP